MPALEWKKQRGLGVLTDEALRLESSILVAFTSRAGGVSAAPYESLNLAYHVGDDPANVAANRRRLCDALGLRLEKLTCAQQVHGVDVAVVADEEIGRGSGSYDASIPATDAMTSASTGVALAMFFADCVPVVVVDPIRRAIGVAHAGWKGVLGGIPAALVARMADAFGSVPRDLLAYVGPAIGRCHYRVDSTRIALFAREFPDFVRPTDTHLDLPDLVEKSLDATGVPRQNVAAADTCTAENTDVFYSYRSEGGETGRHAAIVSIVT
jgi:YfiH family protein